MKLASKIFKQALLVGGLSLSVMAYAGDNLIASSMTLIDDYTLQGKVNFISGLETGDSDGNINAVIEIPKGTKGKWEVSGDDPTKIIWEFKKGKPRTVEYLNGYPANYGTVPRTAMPADFGGDGEPLDIVVLGKVLPRGEVVKVKVLGILNMQEGDEFDGKLLAAVVGSPEAKASSWQELNTMMPKSVDVVSSWFANYKGPGEITLTIGSTEEAMEIVTASANAYGKTK
jgi:inorganic pyrophosphatase